MSRLTTVARDLRALGSSAPLRAAYEASKRSGFHAVLFREQPESKIRSVPIGLGAVIAETEAARRRCLDDATAVLSEGTRVFGCRVATGVHESWNSDPQTGDEWPEHEAWWRIDIRSADRMADVKWVWEAARHRDLVVLARAAALDPGGRWLSKLEAMLRAWLLQCRPERGVNWYSSLELALRAISWAQVLELVGEDLAPDVRSGMDGQLLASARHIVRDLPYTASSMRNNHLLGDGLGLMVIGRLFPDHPSSRRWRRLGDAVFLRQLDRHMHPDGAMIEDSLSYHRFVLEMLIVRSLLGGGGPKVQTALMRAGDHLERLGALDGPVPQFGDWDEGRVLADSSPPGSVAGSAWAALALSGRSVPAVMWCKHDELAWYVAPTASDVAAARETHEDGGVVAGPFHVLRHGLWRAWVKTGSSPSHQHADIGSVWPMFDGRWLLRDPGTGTYNGPIAVRNGFRGSSAHPVWCPEGDDQLVPHRAFRWMRQVQPLSVAHLTSDRSIVLSVHDAFVKSYGARVARLVDLDAHGFVVVDFIERSGGVPWRMTLPLGDDARPLVGLPTRTISGVNEPFRGWHSDTYGQWTPSPWVIAESVDTVHVWGATDQEVSTDRNAARVGHWTYSVDWSTPHRVSVRVGASMGGEILLEVADG